MNDLLGIQIRESCKLALPNGLKELMEDISREVLRAQPDNLYSFITEYLAAMLDARDNLCVAVRVCEEVCNNTCHPELTVDLRALGLDDQVVADIEDIVKEYFENGNVNEKNLLMILSKKLNLESEMLPAVQEAVRSAYCRHFMENPDQSVYQYENFSVSDLRDSSSMRAAKNTVKFHQNTFKDDTEVAVLLMDTQGTFDNTSSVKDCSTIFALSTLLSSVQIYNLSMRIQEDHLQHLQLFTEYGKLIKEETGKPFQVLEFLVRDWFVPYQYAYGAEGGQEYLSNQLDINKPGLLPEMRKLREHIFASFESVTCFLMPHPGFGVLDPNFKGRSNEIGPEFKNGLKQQVASLLSETKMKVKQMNGQQVKAKELFQYFKTYMTIFNSSKIPEPTSILEATSKAGFLLAINEAREQYETNMDRVCGPDAPSVPAKDVQRQHNIEVEAAKARYKEKKKLGSKENEAKYLAQLTKTLSDREMEYLQINLGKTQKAISDAKKAYELKVNEISKGQPLCVHATDLKNVHDDAFDAALDEFKKNRKLIYQTEDPDEKMLRKELEKQYIILRNTNIQNNRMAISDLKQEYWQYMLNKCLVKPSLTEDQFTKEHEKALKKAVADFELKRSFPNEYTEDTFKHQLEGDIEFNFIQLKQINNSANKQSFQIALIVFNENMPSVSEIRRHCLAIPVLKEEYEDAVCNALKVFRPNSDCSEGFNINDTDEALILRIFQDRFEALNDINDTANDSAVLIAYDAFRAEYDSLIGASWWWLLVVPIFIDLSKKSKYIEQAKERGREVFYSKRRDRRFKGFDRYSDQLETKMSEY